MKAIRALLADRRRSQQGSVLSAVLIIVAFLSIIVGALMTSLSTNFLLSNALMNRVTTEATVNSAAELAFNQLESVPITSGCPPLNPVTLNGRTAAVSYLSCWPAVRENPKFTNITGSASFNVDGTHSTIPNTSQDLYVVGDAAGNVYAYQFGQSSPNWSKNLQSNITGPPMAMQDAACQSGPPCPDVGGAGGNNADITYLVPIAGGSSGCPANACVVFLGQDVPNAPDKLCYMSTNAAVTSRPAAGAAFPQLAYFGDNGGTLYAYNATEFTCSNNNGPATQVATAVTPGNAPIVAGPIVFPNGTHDELYVVTSKGTSSQLQWYTYQQGSLSQTPVDSVTLPFPNPVGIAVERTSPLPARLVITFAGGGVAIVTTNANFDPRVVASALVGNGFASAPYWCGSCPGGPQIGVASTNGTLYILDTNLTLVASFAGASAIRTAPSSDGVGEWFFGADDGYLYELQLTPGQSSLVQVARYGALGKVGSSVQVAGCPAGICMYVGTANNGYIVSLDARDAKITACLSNAPPACSGGNPRLWTQVEVGAYGSPQTVHVQGWSYYSP